MKSQAWLGALAAIALSGFGCVDESCNAMYPSCALEVGFEHQAWEPGSHTFHIVAEGETISCTIGLPLRPTGVRPCPDPRIGFSRFWDGMDWPQEEWPEAIFLFDSPKAVEVIVEREGAELGRGSYRPRYARTEPNGEGCGVCRNATETLTF